MTDAYDDWRETRLRLKAEPDSVYLMRVENSLRPAALTAWLERFAEDAVIQDDDGDRESNIALVSAEKQSKFLAVLDDLRQPAYRPDETRAGMQRQVSEALTAMRKLPWTGDHLYGDALDDASLVLRAVLAGKKMPVLERFRCPSLYQAKKAPLPIRCERQLPHEGKHSVANVGEWTDEQSVNPPKNYDEPPKSSRCGASVEYSTAGESSTQYCKRPIGHDGNHMSPSGVSWTAGVRIQTSNPDPVNRPPVELTDEQLDDLATEVFGDGECCVQNPKDVGHPREISAHCVRAKAHGGLHRDADGIRWEK